MSKTAKVAKVRLKEIIAKDRRMEQIEALQMVSRAAHRALEDWKWMAQNSPWQRGTGGGVYSYF